MLAAAAWLGGTALLAGPMSEMKPMKFDRAELSLFEDARPIRFRSYGIYKFAEHRTEEGFDFRGPHAHISDNPKDKDVQPSAVPEPVYDSVVGLLLIAFGGLSLRRKTRTY
jgi:hypothetical protein